MKIFIIILNQSLVNYLVFYFSRLFITLKDKEDKGLEKLFLLSKIQIVLVRSNTERVHRNRFILTVGDICTLKIMTDTLITISCINHYNVSILHQKLSYNRIHVETFSASTWTKTKKVCIVGHLNFSFLTCNINRHRNTLTVSIEYIKS